MRRAECMSVLRTMPRRILDKRFCDAWGDDSTGDAGEKTGPKQ
jgi:hypothetical protein